MQVLEVRNLVKQYKTDNGSIRAVSDVSLKVKKGEFVSIIGKSGSGKTTLLHLIGGLEKADSGEIIIDSNDIKEMNDEKLSIFRRENIGFIFQNYNLLPILDIQDNILLPLQLGGKQMEINFFHEIISMLGIEDKLKNMPNELSGGEQQRVAIARALITKPSIVLADEPTGNLDPDTSENVLLLLKNMERKFEQTLIMVTHNKLISKMADRRICMDKGKIINVEQ